VLVAGTTCVKRLVNEFDDGHQMTGTRVRTLESHARASIAFQCNLDELSTTRHNQNKQSVVF
jgi:hypothetical protein